MGIRVPFFAIVGRPNVGKSTLFNRLMGKRISIVEKTAGTTRDRVSAILELPSERRVELCDMGGLGGTDDAFDRDVDRQIKAAMSLADAVIFVVDSRDGVIPLDRDIANRILKLGKPIVLVANKAETRELESLSGEFYQLGAGEPLALSAREGTSRQELLERLDATLDKILEADAKTKTHELAASSKPTGPEKQAHELRVAVIGRRNAGKSSFVNALFGSERVIVSDTPGTTRDAVDVRCIVDGEPIILIDTAGLRKRGKADDAIEIISHSRAMEAVRRADVAIVLLDALRDLSEVDKKIIELAAGEYKAVVLVGNKWDLVGEGMSIEQFADYVRKKTPSISFAPVAAISCENGFNLKAPIELARELYRQSLVRVTTGELNRAVHDAYARRRPRKKRHLEARLYFATQIRTNPVTIVLFVNKPNLFDDDYQRYLASELRSMLPFSEVPLKLVIRERRGLLERGLTKAKREQRSLEKMQKWLESEGHEDAAPSPEALAELDQEGVSDALAEELAVEEKATATPAFDDEFATPADGADVEGEDGEPAPAKRPKAPMRDLLYGEDAELVRRRHARQNRRGRGQGGGKKP
jgi:GTP-binding protein